MRNTDKVKIQEYMEAMTQAYKLGATDALELCVQLNLDPARFLEGIKEQSDLDTWERELS